MTDVTNARIATELVLALIAVLVAFALPELGHSVFQRIEKRALRLARRQAFVITMVGLAPILIRIAVLPWRPIPPPAVHDEFSHLLAADTFASGRITNPTHPMWVHFETFHVNHKPTYMSMYPPAQGLALAAGQRLAGAPWVGVCFSVGLMCSAICWMLYGWFQGIWPLFGAVVVVLRIGVGSYWMNSYWGGAVPAIGGALVLGAVPRLVRSRRRSYSVALGLGLLILANSRPFEGLLLAAGTALAVAPLVVRAGRPHWRLAVPVAAPAVAILLAGALTMGYYNLRVFGSPLTPPYTTNRATYAVAPVFFWQSPAPAPKYNHKILRDFFLSTELRHFEDARTLRGFLEGILSRVLVLAFFYLGPLGLFVLVVIRKVTRTQKLRILAVVAAVFFIGLVLNVFVAAHYMAPALGLVVALLLVSMRRLRKYTSGGHAVGVFLVRAVPAICVAVAVVQLVWPPPLYTMGLARADLERKLQSTPGRHLVLVRYSPDRDPNGTKSLEWVYNAADIDAATIVWAREMCRDRDREIIDYFRDRKVWLLEPDVSPSRIVRLNP